MSLLRKIFRSTVFWVLLVFTAINVVLNFWRDSLGEYRESNQFVWHYKVQELLDSPRPEINAVILGDSQTMSAVLPGRLGRKLGARVLNLGLPSQQPEGMAALARLFPEALPGLKRVYININPYNMFKSPVYQAFQTYYKAELFNHSRPPMSRWPGQLGTSSGKYLHQALLSLPLYDLHDSLYTALSFEKNLSDIQLPALRRNPGLLPASHINNYLRSPWRPLEIWSANRAKNRMAAGILDKWDGYWIWMSFEAPGPGSCARKEKLPLIPGKVLYPDRKKAMEAWVRLLQELRRHKYEVYLIEVPFSRDWESTTLPKLVAARLEEKMLSLQKQFPELKLPVRPVNFPREDSTLFNDWTHLSYCGAVKYTDWLADVLAE